MKRIIFFTIALFLFLSISCKQSLNDEFENANKDVKEKLVSQIVVNSTENDDIDGKYSFNYDGNMRLSSISDGEDNSFFTYDSDSKKLVKISTQDEPLIMADAYKSPYDFFEDGNVKSYDDKGNPKEVEVFHEDYNGGNFLYGQITYDPNPNPLYYTIKAGGLIDVLDQVNLNIGSLTSPSLVKASKMLMFNNFKSAIFRNIEGDIEFEIQSSTDYDADGYAVFTTLTSLSKDETTETHIKYSYK